MRRVASFRRVRVCLLLFFLPENADELGGVDANKSNQSDRGFTNILKMTGNILVKSGVAQTNDLQALLDNRQHGRHGHR